MSISTKELIDNLDADVAEMDSGFSAQVASQERAEQLGRMERENTVRELATLPPLEYDVRRKQEAKRLAIRVRTLDAEVDILRGSGRGTKTGGGGLHLAEVEPWPEAVDGAIVLDELAALFVRYLVLPDGAADAMSLWVMHTHAMDAANVTARLAFTSPEKRCGKTTALSMLKRLVAHPLLASNITAPAVFRTIEAAHPTLLIDEADTFLRDNDELRGVLNSGHSRDGAFAVRLVGDEHLPQTFSTWAAVAIALIGNLPSTLDDRAINVPMRRKHAGERTEKLRRQHYPAIEAFARKAARWTRDNMAALANSDPQSPDALDDRAEDHWRPLFAIADRAGGEWPHRAREAALKLSGERSETSNRVTLLSDLRNLFAEINTDRLSSADICAAMADKEGRPWPEYRHGKPITPAQLAAVLKPFGIFPDSIRIGDKTPKGYKLSDFHDAFARYLLPSQAATPQQAHAENSFCDVSSRNTNLFVADVPITEQPTERMSVAALRNQRALSDEDAEIDRLARADGWPGQ